MYITAIKGLYLIPKVRCFVDLRGYQKRIVCLKRTESPMIEEAYFVLSNDASKNISSGEFIKEANKIIEENSKEKKKKDGRLAAFFAGAVCASLIAASLFILTRYTAF